MRTWIEIDEQALLHNYKMFSALAGSAAAVMPVLKSNAYGHGLKEIFSALQKAPTAPSWLGVNYLEEANTIRQAGFAGRILVVGPTAPQAMTTALASNAEVFLSSSEQLQAWLSLAKKPLVHLKIDTGMSRQGFYLEDLGTILPLLKKHKDLVVGLCSHFANVEDVLSQDYANLQLQRFQQASAHMQAAGFTALRHMASSSSALILPESRMNLIRIGISLYGLWPSKATRISYLQLHPQGPELRPVLSWRTEIAQLKTVKAGTFVGYGCTYRATHDLRLAVLPVGYFEGYPRLAGSANAYVLIKGQRCPILGRVCMNMLMVEVTHVPNISSADIATLIGQDGPERIDASLLGDWAQTIHYEIVTQINSALLRRVI